MEDAASQGDEMEVVGVRRKSGAAGVEFELTKEAEHKPPAAMSSALPLDDILRFMMTGAEPKIALSQQVVGTLETSASAGDSAFTGESVFLAFMERPDTGVLNSTITN
jgi:predicted RNA polymerase sigma factor